MGYEKENNQRGKEIGWIAIDGAAMVWLRART